MNDPQTFDAGDGERADAQSGEIMQPELAADGTPAPFAARTAGSLLDLLERGAFSHEVIDAMTALGTGMRELAERTGKKQKGTLTIKLALTTDDSGEAFFVDSSYTVKAPPQPRPKTLLWQDERGHMTPTQPRQRVFFGVRGVEHGPREVRTIT